MKYKMNTDNRCILLHVNFHSVVLILLSGPMNFSPDLETMLGMIWFDRNIGLMVLIKFSLNDQAGERKMTLMWSMFFRCCLGYVVRFSLCWYINTYWNCYNLMNVTWAYLRWVWNVRLCRVISIFTLVLPGPSALWVNYLPKKDLVYADANSGYHFLHKILRWLWAAYGNWDSESTTGRHCKHLEDGAYRKSQEAVSAS